MFFFHWDSLVPLEFIRFVRHRFLGEGVHAMGNRYTHTEEFRREVVELARSSDQPRYEVAESLEVS